MSRQTVSYIGWSGSKDFAENYADYYGMDLVECNMKGDFYRDVNKIKDSRFCIIWNGYQFNSRLAVDVCRRLSIPYLCFEFGMLPQDDTFFVDSAGFNRESSLNGPLHWVRDDEFHALHTTRAGLQTTYPLNPGTSVLAPMQVHNDTQVVFNTPYRNMPAFVRELDTIYPDQHVRIRKHPKSPQEFHIPQRFTMDEEPCYLKSAAESAVVVGLTSTCLIEAAVLGVPVLALGDCPFRYHQRSDHDRLAAAYLARNISREDNPAPLAEKMGLYPL